MYRVAVITIEGRKAEFEFKSYLNDKLHSFDLVPSCISMTIIGDKDDLEHLDSKDEHRLMLDLTYEDYYHAFHNKGEITHEFNITLYAHPSEFSIAYDNFDFDYLRSICDEYIVNKEDYTSDETEDDESEDDESDKEDKQHKLDNYIQIDKQIYLKPFKVITKVFSEENDFPIIVIAMLNENNKLHSYNNCPALRVIHTWWECFSKKKLYEELSNYTASIPYESACEQYYFNGEINHAFTFYVCGEYYDLGSDFSNLGDVMIYCDKEEYNEIFKECNKDHIVTDPYGEILNEPYTTYDEFINSIN